MTLSHPLSRQHRNETLIEQTWFRDVSSGGSGTQQHSCLTCEQDAGRFSVPTLFSIVRVDVPKRELDRCYQTHDWPLTSSNSLFQVLASLSSLQGGSVGLCLSILVSLGTRVGRVERNSGEFRRPRRGSGRADSKVPHTTTRCAKNH